MAGNEPVLGKIPALRHGTQPGAKSPRRVARGSGQRDARLLPARIGLGLQGAILHPYFIMVPSEEPPPILPRPISAPSYIPLGALPHCNEGIRQEPQEGKQVDPPCGRAVLLQSPRRDDTCQRTRRNRAHRQSRHDVTHCKPHLGSHVPIHEIHAMRPRAHINRHGIAIRLLRHEVLGRDPRMPAIEAVRAHRNPAYLGLTRMLVFAPRQEESLGPCHLAQLSLHGM